MTGVTGSYISEWRIPTPPSLEPRERSLTAQPATGAGGRKLRDSCEACATSKLKCPRQKPACSRCAKRGVPCTYLATRRGGRKSVSSTESSNARRDNNHASPPSTEAPTIVCDSPVDELASLGGDWFPRRQEDFLSQVSGSSSSCDILWPIRSVVLGARFEDYVASPETMLTPFDVPDQTQNFFAELGGKEDLAAFLGPLPNFEDATAGTVTHSDARTTFSSNTPQSRSAGSGTTCLDRAMELLKELSPNNSCSACSSLKGSDNTSASRTTRDIIATNKRAIEAVMSILDCSCSQDGILLSVLLMTVLRTLNWYTAAARIVTGAGGCSSSSASEAGRPPSPTLACPGSATADATTDSSGIERSEENPRHMVAQRVLSELHNVQRLAKQLSEKMDQQTQQRGVGMAGTGQAPISLADEDALRKDASPFSSSTWDQLDVELKQKLKSLSGGVISVLRGD